MSRYTFEYDVYTNAQLYVPEGCSSKYKNDNAWGRFANIQEINMDEFEVDGIRYKKIGDNEVEVTCKDNNGSNKDYYEGNIVIPSEVAYLGTTYSVMIIGYEAFAGSSALTSITIPSSVTGIGKRAFNGCSGLTSIVIPNSVMSIEWAAFEGCSGLLSVTVSDSVRNIEYEAFLRCSSLTDLSLGAGIREIGENAFGGCTAIKKITCYALRTPISEFNSFDYDTYDNADVYVPQESLDDYKNDSVWKRFFNLHALISTGINGVITGESTCAPQKVYDLQGRKLQKPERGLNIINGKKVMVK